MGKILETHLDQGREAGSDDVMRNDALYFYGTGKQVFEGGTEDRGDMGIEARGRDCLIQENAHVEA